jgi:hypothetical protein
MPTSSELMRLAKACAERLDLPRRGRRFPSFADTEEQCATQYEDLLGLLHDDEVFQPADVERQEELVRAIQIVLPEHVRGLVDELVDNQAAQVWLQQEGAFHLGMAVGLRLAQAGVVIQDEGVADEEDEEEDEVPRYRRPEDYYDEDEDEDKEEEE